MAETYFRAKRVIDPGASGNLQGYVYFQRLIQGSGGVLSADFGDGLIGVLGEPIEKGQVVNGQIKAMDGTVGVPLLAHTDDLDLDGTLYYRATFAVNHVRTDGKTTQYPLKSIVFPASTDTTDVNLQVHENTIAAEAIPGASLPISALVDATTFGRNLLTLADAAEARTAIHAVTVVSFNGSTWPSRPADPGPVIFVGGIAPGNEPPGITGDVWIPTAEDGTVTAEWSAITGKPAGVDALLDEFSSSGKLTVQTVDLGAATDTTWARSGPGRATIEGSPVLTPVELAALSAKTSLVSADLMALFDSEASGAAKKISLTSLSLWSRANEPDVLTSGEGSMPRDVATTTATLGSQSLRLRYFTARKTETVTKVRTYTGSTAAGATPTVCRVGVYSVDPVTGDLTLVASTPNDTTVWAAASATYEKALSASWSKVAGTRYAVGALCVTAATAPTVVANAIGSSTVAARPPRLTGTVAGQSDLPSSVAAASVTASTSGVFVEMLP